MSRELEEPILIKNLEMAKLVFVRSVVLFVRRSKQLSHCCYHPCRYHPLDEIHLSTSASTRRARRSDAATLEQNKRIFLSTLLRTGFNTEVCSYLSPS